MGLTTFAESPEPTRSDCHAWSASLCYDLLATVCGITSTSSGFNTLQIKPALGDLHYCEGTIPHPKGAIHVKSQYAKDAHWNVYIKIPATISGTFIWKGQSQRLNGGNNYFRS